MSYKDNLQWCGNIIYMEQYLNVFVLHTEYYIFVCRKDKKYHTWPRI